MYEIFSHVQVPTPLRRSDSIIRVYFSSRDYDCRSRPYYFDMDLKSYEIVAVCSSPLLEIGEPGTFDDCGITPSCVLDISGKIYFYYIGWTRDYRLPYKNAIGLAVSDDGGNTFVKASLEPVLDRDFQSPYFNATPFVIADGGIYRMYYLSCTKWDFSEADGWVPHYRIECADSRDGVAWKRRVEKCIDYKNDHEAIARPYVVKNGGKYYMWYSYRDTKDFRRNKNNGYMIGFAESVDGLNWTRRDGDIGIVKSESGWDSEMMCYPSVFANEDKLVY